MAVEGHPRRCWSPLLGWTFSDGAYKHILGTLSSRSNFATVLHHAPATALLTRCASVVLLAGRSYATRGALQGDALSLLAFGGSASSSSSAADFVEMQLVLRCGQCSGARR